MSSQSMELRFSLQAIGALDDLHRMERLRNLESELMRSFEGDADPETFFARSHELVEELKWLGHGLWSFDSDGEEFEIWCGDWTPEDTGGPLNITFRYPREVEVRWRSS